MWSMGCKYTGTKHQVRIHAIKCKRVRKYWNNDEIENHVCSCDRFQSRHTAVMQDHQLNCPRIRCVHRGCKFRSYKHVVQDHELMCTFNKSLRSTFAPEPKHQNPLDWNPLDRNNRYQPQHPEPKESKRRAFSGQPPAPKTKRRDTTPTIPAPAQDPVPAPVQDPIPVVAPSPAPAPAPVSAPAPAPPQPSLSAKDIEELVAKKMESMLMVRHSRSRSRSRSPHRSHSHNHFHSHCRVRSRSPNIYRSAGGERTRLDS